MSCVRGESAADEKEGEGVFIAAPQKLAVAEVLCVYRNFRPVQIHTAERVLSETTWELRREGRNFRPS